MSLLGEFIFMAMALVQGSMDSISFDRSSSSLSTDANANKHVVLKRLGSYLQPVENFTAVLKELELFWKEYDSASFHPSFSIVQHIRFRRKTRRKPSYVDMHLRLQKEAIHVEMLRGHFQRNTPACPTFPSSQIFPLLAHSLLGHSDAPLRLDRAALDRRRAWLARRGELLAHLGRYWGYLEQMQSYSECTYFEYHEAELVERCPECGVYRQGNKDHYKMNIFTTTEFLYPVEFAEQEVVAATQKAQGQLRKATQHLLSLDAGLRHQAAAALQQWFVCFTLHRAMRARERKVRHSSEDFAARRARRRRRRRQRAEGEGADPPSVPEEHGAVAEDGGADGGTESGAAGDAALVGSAANDPSGDCFSSLEASQESNTLDEVGGSQRQHYIGETQKQDPVEDMKGNDEYENMKINMAELSAEETMDFYRGVVEELEKKNKKMNVDDRHQAQRRQLERNRELRRQFLSERQSGIAHPQYKVKTVTPALRRRGNRLPALPRPASAGGGAKAGGAGGREGEEEGEGAGGLLLGEAAALDRAQRLARALPAKKLSAAAAPTGEEEDAAGRRESGHGGGGGEGDEGTLSWPESSRDGSVAAGQSGGGGGGEGKPGPIQLPQKAIHPPSIVLKYESARKDGLSSKGSGALIGLPRSGIRARRRASSGDGDDALSEGRTAAAAAVGAAPSPPPAAFGAAGGLRALALLPERLAAQEAALEMAMAGAAAARGPRLEDLNRKALDGELVHLVLSSAAPRLPPGAAPARLVLPLGTTQLGSGPRCGARLPPDAADHVQAVLHAERKIDNDQLVVTIRDNYSSRGTFILNARGMTPVPGMKSSGYTLRQYDKVVISRSVMAPNLYELIYDVQFPAKRPVVLDKTYTRNNNHTTTKNGW